MKKSLLLLVAMIFGITVNAQQGEHAHCGTDEHVQEVLTENPAMAEIFEAKRAELFQLAENAATNPTKKSSATVYTVPVVFHVIYDSPQDNIDRSQIMDALRILNEDYRLQNSDAGNLRAIFQNRQADTEIEFTLAKKDENGNCTEGITRMQSSLSVDASPRDAVKQLVQWDPDKYLNIWVVRSIINSSSSTGTILGYANFPWMAANIDGIVIRHDALGVIGTAAYDGRTLTHEVGHYLGLLHTFQGGCSGSGDGISDTPPVADASYGCDLSRNSCTNDSYPDMIENYMDYSDGACQNTFTTGQKNVMRSVLQSASYRQTLVSSTNLDETGVNNPPACQPVALFQAINHVICPGDTVSFIDETEDGDPDTYQWSFPGGTPSTSADPNPTVIYNTPGSYQVTLNVSNSAGSSTLTKQHIVHVKPTYTKHQAQWQESFEDVTIPTPDISVVSDDDVAFELTTNAASNGSQSIFLNNYSISYTGESDEFTSPNISTLFASGTQLSFDYAFASKTGTGTDKLYVYASRDCGKTWNVLRLLPRILLETSSATTANFIPNSSEWKSVSISMSNFAQQDPIQIKFVFENDGGNNLYIDNINFTSSNVGIEETSLAQTVSVYPNPSNGSVNINLGSSNSDVELSVVDLYGKEVLRYTLTDSHTTLDNLNLSSGVYILNFTDGKDRYSQKLIIE